MSIADDWIRNEYTQWNIQFSSVQSLSCVWLFATLWIAAHQASLSITNSRVYSSTCPSSQWCHPATSSSVIPFSFCTQSLPESGYFPMSQLFAWGSQSIGVPSSTTILPKNTQDWSALGWTDWISLQSKGLSRVFSNTTVQKHQFFGTRLSSQSNSHIHTWPLEVSHAKNVQNSPSLAFHLCLLQIAGSIPQVAQCILECILHLILCASQSPSSVSPLPRPLPTGNQ